MNGLGLGILQRILATGVELNVWILVARAIGLYFRHSGHRFAWDLGQQEGSHRIPKLMRLAIGQPLRSHGVEHCTTEMPIGNGAYCRVILRSGKVLEIGAQVRRPILVAQNV